MQLMVRGELTTTTATEFRLLDYWRAIPAVSSAAIICWTRFGAMPVLFTPRSVDVYVRRIREKIEVDPENPRYLKTVRGAGYRFELPKASNLIDAQILLPSCSRSLFFCFCSTR